MNKLKSLKLPRLTRPWKTVRNLLFLAAALLLLYLFAGAPAFSDEQEFRRAENQSLVGPSKILAILDNEGYRYDRLVVADDGDGVILYPIYKNNTGTAELSYWKKTGKVTLVAEQPVSVFDLNTLDVIVFDSVPAAARAELCLSLYDDSSGMEFQHDYALTSAREYDGFFRFVLSHVFDDESSDEYNAEMIAFYNFALISSHSGLFRGGFSASVRFYDEAGKMIDEQSMPVSRTESKT